MDKPPVAVRKPYAERTSAERLASVQDVLVSDGRGGWRPAPPGRSVAETVAMHVTNGVPPPPPPRK